MQQPIYIKWIDSAHSGGWQRLPNDNTGTEEIESVGYLMKEDKQHIEIAQSVGGHNQVAEVLSIPKSVILERKPVTMKRSAK